MAELKSISDLTQAFKKFPSVGAKSAERMAYALLDMDKDDINYLISKIKDVSEKIHPCPVCGLLTDNDKCSVCSDINRTHDQIIVITSPKDVMAFEEMNQYRGMYHVLGGEISSYHNVSPSDLRIKELLERIDNEHIKEVIIATNPTIEGDMTALYLAKLLENKDVKVSRIGYGLPVGGNLDYADALTIKRSFDARTEINGEKK